MLNRFIARGYRNLDTEVELGRCNVLIGPNNCGKSNLMRAIAFAADGARTTREPSWDAVIRQHGGAGLVRRSVEPRYKPAKVVLAWQWTTDDFESRSHLELELNNLGTLPAVVLDTFDASDNTFRLSTRTENGAVHVEGSNGTETRSYDSRGSEHPLLGSAAPVPNDTATWDRRWDQLKNYLVESVRRMLRQSDSFSLADLRPSAVKRPSNDESQTALHSDGSNLAFHLRHLESEHLEGLQPIQRAMQELLPTLTRIWAKSPPGAGATWLEMVHGSVSTPLLEASDGTVMALLLATLLHGPQKRSLLLLDEPELNLHPAWLKVVARWLSAPSAAEQVLFSTHSTDLLDALTDGFRAGEVRVLVADPERGFRNLDAERMSAFFEQGYELGDLYRVGEPTFGGWPW